MTVKCALTSVIHTKLRELETYPFGSCPFSIDLMPTLDCYSIINIADLIALRVSFEKAMYSGEEGKVIAEIRLKATAFEMPFSAQIFATTLDTSRSEKAYEATSGELCVLLVLPPGPVALCSTFNVFSLSL